MTEEKITIKVFSCTDLSSANNYSKGAEPHVELTVGGKVEKTETYKKDGEDGLNPKFNQTFTFSFPKLSNPDLIVKVLDEDKGLVGRETSYNLMCKKTISYKELTEKYLNGKQHTIELEKADGTLTDAKITLEFKKESPPVEEKAVVPQPEDSFVEYDPNAEEVAPGEAAQEEDEPEEAAQKEVAPGEIAPGEARREEDEPEEAAQEEAAQEEDKPEEAAVLNSHEVAGAIFTAINDHPNVSNSVIKKLLELLQGTNTGDNKVSSVIGGNLNYKLNKLKSISKKNKKNKKNKVTKRKLKNIKKNKKNKKNTKKINLRNTRKR
mgnify:CR=1 FL=1|tara:strand:- start:1838 stop:2803 length:966 start_codon:yes stop_codon:yes gene_type:complete